MGPKKKGKGKKKGEGKKKKAAAEAANAEPIIPLEENTKQFYLIQIQSLRKKVDE